MTLEALLEQRAQAMEKYEAFVSPIIAENRSLTEDEETQKTELRGAVDRLDTRIDEVKAEEARQAEIAEARKAAGVASVDASVVKEARTYEYEVNKRTGKPTEVHGRSYAADLIWSSLPHSPHYTEARSRLERHGYEQAVEARNGSDEGKTVLASIREQHRENESRAREAEREIRERGNAGAAEQRDATTSTIAGFTTPVYFVDQWLEYRVPGRPFANLVEHHDLPAYGLTVYRPHFTGTSSVGVQSGEGQTIAHVDPTSAYLSASLSTLAGEVIVSIQLLERSELRDMDAVLFQDLQRQYAKQVDQLALTAALANAGAITYTDAAGFHLIGGTAGDGNFWTKVAGAKAAVKTAAGQEGYPNVLVVHPERWESIIATGLDGSSRPLIVPDPNGPMNAMGAGNEAAIYEGRTGYTFQNLAVVEDLNIPAPGTGNDQAIVADLSEVWLFENTPTPRVLPQTNAHTLEVVLQAYGYASALVGYPSQVQAISGTGMSAITF